MGTAEAAALAESCRSQATQAKHAGASDTIRRKIMEEYTISGGGEK
jgi:hypothetical protein